MTLADPTTRKWTREEYYQMGELGFFQDQRVELIEGEIIEMAPQKNVHAAVVSLCERAVSRAFGEGYWVRMQLPLYLTESSEPEPDISVAPGGPRDYIATDHPRSALLVVEVSETTLRFDRKVKTRLYAAAGIEDYWVVNLIDRQVEVHRKPTTDSSGQSGYEETRTFKSGESITPLAAPGASILVADLLP
jgi:Uma2 family endonuclease